MNLGELKEWILVISGTLTLVSIATGSFAIAIGSSLALKEYRLKLKAEQRAADSEKVETDVRLLKAFTELMDLANGRGGYVVSERAIEELFKHNVFTESEFNSLESVKKRIGEFPIFTLPVGSASQDAAIAAIATLGDRHEVLKEAAIQALESTKVFRRDMAEKHLERIKRA
jgi:hypothetical protein